MMTDAFFETITGYWIPLHRISAVGLMTDKGVEVFLGRSIRCS